jgi:hypothetical protein
MWKRLIRIAIFVVLVVGVYFVFFYTPYSEKKLAKAWVLANSCDDDALHYLADYYEKRNDLTKYQHVIQIGADCGKSWASDFLKYLKKQPRP